MAKKKKSAAPVLNDQQQLFCREYIVDFNGTQAAIRAGYSPKTAAATASRLLNNVNTQAFLNTLRSEREKRTNITADRVVEQLAKIAFMDVKSIIDWGQEERVVDHKITRDKEGNETKEPIKEFFDFVRLLPKDQVDGTLIQNVKMTKYGMAIEMPDRMRAFEMLAKHLGVYDERQQTTVDVGAYVKALYDRASAGDVWQDFNNSSPDGSTGDDDDGED